MDLENRWNFLKESLYDFIKERGFTDVVLGLSGGIDSAVVSVLASDALGKDRVHCLMMASKYTTPLSIELASLLANNLDLDFRVIEIQKIIDEYNELFSNLFSEVEPLVSENIQARVRGNILMSFSNEYNWLTLCCSNRSEAAMGYCTLYGDTVGVVSPIGNLYKTEVYDLARWRNKISKVIPEEIICRFPSAELSRGQKDEDTLPPYSLLDKILKELLDQKKPVSEIKTIYPEETVLFVSDRLSKMSFKKSFLPISL